MSRCQRTGSFTRKVCALLYYVHRARYNKTHFKRLHVLFLHFYIIVWFHIKRRFCTSLSVRVSDSGQPVTYAIFVLLTICVTKYTAACHQYSHNIIYFYIILWLYIWRVFCAIPSPVQENVVWEKLSHYSLLHPCLLQIS